MQISVNRHQYGIGQGCFHTQRITAEGGPHPDDMFDFVYDCGSDQAISGPSDTLAWAIKHYRPKRSIDNESALQVVDALFISHFHADHINGLYKLTTSKEIRRIYVPHYTPPQVLALIGTCSQWILSATLTDIQNFFTELYNLANGRDLFGKRTVYVLGANDEFVPPSSNLPDGGPLAAPAPDFVTMPSSISQSGVWHDTDSILIKDYRNVPVWEIRSWCYSESFGLGVALATALAKIPGWPTTLLSKKPNTRAINWIIKNAKQIHDVYLALIKSLSSKFGVPLGNQNLISMAIYSGPATAGALTGSVRRTNYGMRPRIDVRALNVAATEEFL